MNEIEKIVFDRPIITEIEEKYHNTIELNKKFSSKRSKKALSTVHNDMVRICNSVIEVMDFSAIEGARTTPTQQEYFRLGKSKLDGVNKKSKHQIDEEKPLSTALDVAPYPIDFEDKSKARARFYMLAGHFFQVAHDLYEAGEISHKLRWGGDWDGDKNFDDQSFDDLPHYELIKA